MCYGNLSGFVNCVRTHLNWCAGSRVVTIYITVSGRLTARLVPGAPKRRLRWDEIADAFLGRPDPEWDRDRDLIDQSIGNPWDLRH